MWYDAQLFCHSVVLLTSYFLKPKFKQIFLNDFQNSLQNRTYILSSCSCTVSVHGLLNSISYTVKGQSINFLIQTWSSTADSYIATHL